MARNKPMDSQETYSGIEFEPASDGKQAAEQEARLDDLSEATGATGVTDGSSDALNVAGDGLATALERDILGIDTNADWDRDQTEEFAAESEAAQLTDILQSDEGQDYKISALQDYFAVQGADVAEAAQHLSSVLTEMDNNQTADESPERAADLASEVGRVNETSQSAASLMVGALRTNAGVSGLTALTPDLMR